MPAEPNLLQYAPPPPVTFGVNARASMCLGLSIFFPVLFLCAAPIGGAFMYGVHALADDRLRETAVTVLAGLVGGFCAYWPIPLALIAGIRAVIEIRHSRQRGLWRAIVGMVLASIYAVMPLGAVLTFVRAL